MLRFNAVSKGDRDSRFIIDTARAIQEATDTTIVATGIKKTKNHPTLHAITRKAIRDPETIKTTHVT